MREASGNPTAANPGQKKEPGGAGKHRQHGQHSSTIAPTYRDCASRGIAGLHRRKNK
jgi:hypothetical protein